MVFQDLDRDGQRDPGEPGIPNVLVTLEGPITRSIYTSATGGFAFVGLPVGTYRLSVVALGDPWVPSTDLSYTIEVPRDRCFASLNNVFGFYEGTAPTPTPTPTPTATPTPLPPSLVERCEVRQVVASWNDAVDAGGRNAYLGEALRLRFDRPVGFRFEGFTVPQGVTVTQASLTVWAYWWRKGEMNVDIRADLEVPSEPFTTVFTPISARQASTATVRWEIEDLWRPDQRLTVSGLAPVIQEVISQPDWAPPAPITLLLFADAEDRDRVLYAYDGDPGKAAQLEVCYITTAEEPPAAPPPQPGGQEGWVPKFLKTLWGFLRGQ